MKNLVTINVPLMKCEGKVNANFLKCYCPFCGDRHLFNEEKEEFIPDDSGSFPNCPHVVEFADDREIQVKARYGAPFHFSLTFSSM